MTQLQELTKKIHTHCPELLELSMKACGNPITLEHVLKALVSHVSTYKNSNEGVEAYAYVVDLFAQWELLKPLTEQSEDTIEWLNKVIS